MQSLNVGAEVGVAVGKAVGASEGAADGDVDGAAVGDVVQALQCPGHMRATVPVGSAHPPFGWLNLIRLGQMAGSGP